MTPKFLDLMLGASFSSRHIRKVLTEHRNPQQTEEVRHQVHLRVYPVLGSDGICDLGM